MSLESSGAIFILIDGRVIILKKNTVFVKKIKLRLGKYHEAYHECLQNRFDDNSFLERLINKPDRVLAFEGKKNINILLLLIFEGASSLNEMDRILRHELSDSQMLFIRYLKLENAVISKLYRRNPYTLFRFFKFYHRNFTAEWYDIGIFLCKVFSEESKDRLSESFSLYKTHKILCQENRSNYIQVFMEVYASVLKGAPIKEFEATLSCQNPFFPEIRVYSSYLLYKDFDIPFNIPEGDELSAFTTENEFFVLSTVIRCFAGRS